MSHQIVEVCLYFSYPFFTVVIIFRNNLNEVGSTWERELDPCTFSCIFMTDLWFYRKAVCNAVWLMTMIMQQMCHGVSLSLSVFVVIKCKAASALHRPSEKYVQLSAIIIIYTRKFAVIYLISLKMWKWTTQRSQCQTIENEEKNAIDRQKGKRKEREGKLLMCNKMYKRETYAKESE